MRKKWRCKMEGLKIQWLHKKPPLEERDPNLFYQMYFRKSTKIKN